MAKSSIMKYSVIVALLVIVSACNQGDQEPKKQTEQDVSNYRALKVVDNQGRYKEWYPGHEQLKLEGRQNEKGERTGIWKLYSKNGVVLSITVYTDGKRDGHIIVKHPNGALHYKGQYVMDERVGEWKFYDEQGNLTKTENFGEVD